MAWKEMSGTRRIEDAAPSHVDYIITFDGATTDTVPTNGNTLATILGSGTLPSTGLDAEPTAVQVSYVKKFTQNKSKATVRFRGFYVE
jgi:hypothetical protein